MQEDSCRPARPQRVRRLKEAKNSLHFECLDYKTLCNWMPKYCIKEKCDPCNLLHNFNCPLANGLYCKTCWNTAWINWISRESCSYRWRGKLLWSFIKPLRCRPTQHHLELRAHKIKKLLEIQSLYVCPLLSVQKNLNILKRHIQT